MRSSRHRLFYHVGQKPRAPAKSGGRITGILPYASCRGKFTDKPGRPSDVPIYPYSAYKHQGWVSWPDWLGTQRTRGRGRTYRRFSEARNFARSLQLRSYKEWLKYCQGKIPELPKKPDDIPTEACRPYKNKGWVSWSDWLGKNENKRKSKRPRP